MTGCLVFAFASLIEFAIVNVWSRIEEDLKKTQQEQLQKSIQKQQQLIAQMSQQPHHSRHPPTYSPQSYHPKLKSHKRPPKNSERHLKYQKKFYTKNHQDEILPMFEVSIALIKFYHHKSRSQ